jgi:hypothetical protein
MRGFGVSTVASVASVATVSGVSGVSGVADKFALGWPRVSCGTFRAGAPHLLPPGSRGWGG